MGFFSFTFKEYNFPMSDSLANLTEINLDDLVNSFGSQNQPWFKKAIRVIFRGPAEKFARQMLEYDLCIGETDLPSASRKMLKRYDKDVRVYGQEYLPANGPVLVLSNHPGMTDTLCLFAVINRPDLRVIALDRPFLQSLPNLGRHQFFVSDDPSERMRAVRKGTAHLRCGGALLTFPAGKIEPDPDVYPGAVDSLSDWGDSAGVFMRLAPETRILPVLVRNVLWEGMVKNPVTKLKKERIDREKLGVAFQLLAHIIFNLHPLTVTVQIGQPITLTEIGSNELPAIHEAVLARMKFLITNPPSGNGLSIL
jgi:1-acyl-sn-glycerol-3-phosphate acyltransferase